MNTTTFKRKGIRRDLCQIQKSVVFGNCLKVKHGTNLIFQNILWNVSREDIETPIIGKRVFDPVGCDNRAMLEVARDKLGEEIDVP